MNRFACWGFALAVLSLAACSNEPPPTPVAAAAPAAPAPVVNAADQQFAMQAAASDQFEIQSSQLALQKARSRRVRGFAQGMIDAHTQTTQQLSQIASAEGITIQPGLNSDQQQMLAKLQETRAGAAFDRAYLHDQVVGHEATVHVYENEIATGQNPQLKTFAQQTLPIIQNHLRDARHLGGRP